MSGDLGQALMSHLRLSGVATMDVLVSLLMSVPL